MQTSLELQSKKIADDRRRQRREVREQMDNMLFENETTGLSEEQSERFNVLVEQLESLGPDPKDDPTLGVDLSTNYAELLTGTDKPNRASHRFVDAAGRPILCCAADQNFGTRGDDYQIGEALTGILKGQPLNQQSGSTDSAGGYLLTPELSTRFVDLARANSVCLKAGTPTLNMEARDVRIAKLTADATSVWRAEAAAVQSSEVTFGAVTLSAQTLACAVPISIELIEDSSNVAQLVQQTIMRAMGQKLDAAILEGSGSGAEPTGILNTSGINTVASVGTPTNYDEMTTAVKELLVDNYNGDISGLAWIAHPRDYATYDGLVDTTNQPLRPTQWVGDLQRFSTTELPITGGGGSNESSMIVGDFTQCVLGMQTNGVQIRVSADGIANDGSSDINATSQLLRWIIAYVRADVAVLRPDHFTALTGVTA